jgi:hypothetical protein
MSKDYKHPEASKSALQMFANPEDAAKKVVELLKTHSPKGPQPFSVLTGTACASTPSGGVNCTDQDERLQ